MQSAQTRLPEGDHQSCLHPSALVGGQDSESRAVGREGTRQGIARARGMQGCTRHRWMLQCPQGQSQDDFGEQGNS